MSNIAEADAFSHEVYTDTYLLTYSLLNYYTETIGLPRISKGLAHTI